MAASDRSEPGILVQSFSTPEEHALVYAAVIHSAIDAVIVADEAGLVVAMNPAAEDMFGYAPNETYRAPNQRLDRPRRPVAGNTKQGHVAAIPCDR